MAGGHQTFALERVRAMSTFDHVETEFLLGRTNTAIGRLMVITQGAVEKHISSIFTKLGLPPSSDDHRRVMAVLAWLES